MAPISIGEIHVPGGPGLVAARCLTLTSPPQTGGDLELFFALLAAEAPKKVIEKLADRLTEEIRPVFFSAKGGSGTAEADTRFEAALKQANKTILAFLYEHGLSLPGIKLRGAAAALSGGRLLVASHGAVRGLLYVPQEKTLAPYALFDDAPEKAGEPKFFTSLQDGAFPEGGRLVIATSELFQSLDDAFVRTALGQPDFAKASRDIKTALRNARLPVSILSLSSPLPAHVFAAADDSVQSRTALAPVRSVTAPLRPAAQQAKPPMPKRPAAAPIIGPDIGELIARTMRGAFFFLGRAAGALVAFLWRSVKWLALLPLRLPRAAAVLADRESRAKLMRDCLSAPDRCLSSAVARLNALPSRSRAHFLLLLAVGTVFIHGLGYSLKREIGVREAKAYEATLTEIQQAQSDLDAGMIYDSEDHSRERLARLETMVEALPEKTPMQQKVKADARKGLEDERTKLRHVTAVDKPAVFAGLDGEAGPFSAMAWFGDKLYVFSSGSARVHVFSSEGAASSDPDIPDVSGVASAVPARTGFLLEDASGTVAYWNPDTGETVRYPERLGSGTPILFFQGRLYAADADGTVNRRSVAAEKLGAPADVLRGAPASPSGIAADGAVYLLYPDGSTRKFLKGASILEYNASAIDPLPTRAAALWASQDSGKLVFADLGGDRAYVVDKTTGRLLSQLTAPDFKGLQAAAVDDKGSHVYLLAGNGKIYAVPIE